jgi:predicted Holliday junction resolvase-like endonuclease
MQTDGYALLIAAAAFAALALLVAGIALGRLLGRAEARREADRRVGEEREDAVKRSRAVLSGLAAEQLAPWLPDFPFDPTEVRFVGKPVDFIAFPGASRGEIREVAFVEVKTGSSTPSRQERSLRDAVRAGRVSWIEYRAPDRP